MAAVVVALLALIIGRTRARSCTNITVPVDVSARLGVFDNLPTPITNLDATQFAISSLIGSSSGINGTAQALSGYQTVNKTYHLSVQYCTPSETNETASNSTAPTLQILTHGIAFDKTYWDLSYNNYNYSYVDAALKAGYHTVAYDRLGIGKSSHGEPKNEIQINLEVEALAELTRKLRAGTVPRVPIKYNKIVHTGHSFGSIQSYYLTTLYPDLSDGLVLTGYSTNSSFMPFFTAGNNFEQAYLNQPLRFGNASIIQALQTVSQTYESLLDLTSPIDFAKVGKRQLNYPPGYLVNGNAAALNLGFLSNGHFDPQLLYFAEKKGKQPVTVGELLTIGSVPQTSPFTGPVLIFTGEYDIIFCGGNCTNVAGTTNANIIEPARLSVPQASAFEAYLQPATGHGLTMHYNATAGYEYIQGWLRGHGLGA